MLSRFQDEDRVDIRGKNQYILWLTGGGRLLFSYGKIAAYDVGQQIGVVEDVWDKSRSSRRHTVEFTHRRDVKEVRQMIEDEEIRVVSVGFARAAFTLDFDINLDVRKIGAPDEQER